MLNNLLIYRMLIVNSCVVAFLAWATAHGWVQEIYNGDRSYITYGITLLFLVGIWSLCGRVWRVSKALNGIKNGDAVDVNSNKFLAKGEHLDDLSSWLVSLGLIGTVVGMIMALGAIDLNSLGTADGVQKSIGFLMGGMKVAVYTTLAGGFFGLWLDVNRRLLKTASTLMLEDAKENRMDIYATQAIELSEEAS